MKSIASAPGKVILFGEHFIVYGGKAVLCAINKRITVESELVDSEKIEIESELGAITVTKNEPIQNVNTVFRPVVYIAQKLLRQSNADSGIRVSIRSEIPWGVGLGSSSACCVAAASSVSGLFSSYSNDDILKIALEAEKTVFENASGADSTVCTYGGILEYSWDKIKKLDFTPKFQLVVADSKTTHSTTQVVARVKKFKEGNPEVFSTLCDKEAALIEESVDALKRNDLSLVGQKMIQNQEYLEKIGVSSEVLDSMLRTTSNIAFGAKITGAGDGGCIIAIVDGSNANKTIEALQSKNYDCFVTQIDTAGVEQGKEKIPANR